MDEQKTCNVRRQSRSLPWRSIRPSRLRQHMIQTLTMACRKKIQKIIFILYLITLFKILNHWTHFFGIYMYVLIMFNDDGLEFFCPANQNIYKYILYIHMYNFLTVNLIIIMVKLNFQRNYEELSG